MRNSHLRRLAAGALLASPAWGPAPLPAQRGALPPANVFYPGLAYDAARGVTVLFGGVSPDTTYAREARTFEWDGGAWHVRDAAGPPPRAGHGMVFDSRRGRIVLFGGSHRGEPLGDTWEYDGAQWRRVSTWGPAPRGFFGMAYDSARGRVVLHGGSQGLGRTIFEDTWEWDGTTWMRRATTGLPQVSFHRMAYDGHRARVVSFGGRGAGGETWEWDGTAWTRVSTAGPPARDHHGMAYDSRHGRVVIFGGSGQQTSGQLFDDVWGWDGARWTQLGSGGVSPRGGLPGLAYDVRRDRLVLIGGGGPRAPEEYAGTWEWDGARWARRDR